MGFFSDKKYYIGAWGNFVLRPPAENPTKELLLGAINHRLGIAEVFVRYALQRRYYLNFNKFIAQYGRNSVIKSDIVYDISGESELSTENLLRMYSKFEEEYKKKYLQHNTDKENIFLPMEGTQEYFNYVTRSSDFYTKYDTADNKYQSSGRSPADEETLRLELLSLGSEYPESWADSHLDTFVYPRNEEFQTTIEKGRVFSPENRFRHSELPSTEELENPAAFDVDFRVKSRIPKYHRRTLYDPRYDWTYIYPYANGWYFIKKCVLHAQDKLLQNGDIYFVARDFNDVEKKFGVTLEKEYIRRDFRDYDSRYFAYYYKRFFIAADCTIWKNENTPVLTPYHYHEEFSRDDNDTYSRVGISIYNYPLSGTGNSKLFKWLSPYEIRIYFYALLPTYTGQALGAPILHYDLDVRTIFPNFPFGRLAETEFFNYVNAASPSIFTPSVVVSNSPRKITISTVVKEKNTKPDLATFAREPNNYLFYRYESLPKTPEAHQISPEFYKRRFNNAITAFSVGEEDEIYKKIIQGARLTGDSIFEPVPLKEKWKFFGDDYKSDLLEREIKPLLKYAGFSYDSLKKVVQETGYNHDTRDAWFHFGADATQNSEHMAKYFVKYFEQFKDFYIYDTENFSMDVTSRIDGSKQLYALDENGWYKQDCFVGFPAEGYVDVRLKPDHGYVIQSGTGLHNCAYKKITVNRRTESKYPRGSYTQSIKDTPNVRVVTTKSNAYGDTWYGNEYRKATYLEIIHQETETEAVYYRYYSLTVLWKFPYADNPSDWISLEDKDLQQNIYFPLNVRVLQNMTNYEAHAILNDCARVTIYTVDKITIPWYKNPDRLKTVFSIIEMVMFIYTISTLSLGNPKNVFWEITKSYLLKTLTEELVQRLIKVFSPEIALIIAAALSAAAGGHAIAKSFGNPGLPFIDTVLLSVDSVKVTVQEAVSLIRNTTIALVQEDSAQQTEEASEEFAVFQEQYIERLEELEERENESSGYGLSNPIFYLATMLDTERESPDGFYSRTLNTATADTSIQALDLYANNVLRLPEAGTNFITTQFVSHQLTLYKV